MKRQQFSLKFRYDAVRRQCNFASPNKGLLIRFIVPVLFAFCFAQCTKIF